MQTRKRQTVAFTMDPSTIAALKAAAKDSDRNASQFAERAIKAYLCMLSTTN